MGNFYFMIATKSAPQGGSDPTIMIVMMVVFILFFYLFIVRPQNKRKKDMEKLLNSLKNGDRVVTIGGAHGKVIKVKDNTVTIRVDDKAEITFDKNAIARVVDENGKDKTLSKENSKEKESKDVKSMKDVEKENVIEKENVVEKEEEETETEEEPSKIRKIKI